MLTGERLFEGETASDVLAAVLVREPDWRRFESRVGSEVAKVVRGCLAKDLRQRFSSAGDVALLLERAVREDAHPSRRPATTLPPAPRRRVRRRRPRRRRGDRPRRRRRVDEPRRRLHRRGHPHHRRGPRGRRLVRHRHLPGRPAPRVHRGPARGQPPGGPVAGPVRPGRLPRDGGGVEPVLLPDGAWLGYFTRTELRKVRSPAGQTRAITSFDGGVRFDPWNRRGTRPPTGRTTTPSCSPRASGASPPPSPACSRCRPRAASRSPSRKLDGSELGHQWPTFTPDGRNVVFTVFGSGPRNTHVDVIERRSGARRRLHDNAAFGQVLESGFLVYLDKFYSRLGAVAIDTDTLDLAGPATPLIEGLSGSPASSYAVSRTGTLAYVAAGRGSGENRLVRVGLDGSVATLIPRTGDWIQPRVSPDGRKVVVREIGDECRLWLFDLERQALTPLTTSGDNHQPIWSRTVARSLRPGGRRQGRRGSSARSPTAASARRGDGQCRPRLGGLVGALSRLVLGRVTASCCSSSPRSRPAPTSGCCDGPPGAVGVPRLAGIRGRCRVLARRALGRLRVRRERPAGGLRPRVPKQGGRLSGLARRRRVAPLVA